MKASQIISDIKNFIIYGNMNRLVYELPSGNIFTVDYKLPYLVMKTESKGTILKEAKCLLHEDEDTYYDTIWEATL